MAKHPKRPRDTAERAKLVVEIASHEVPNDSYPFASESAIQPGEARAAAPSPRRRKGIAKKAAAARRKK